MASCTLDDERRELWGSILDEIRRPASDPDHAAACARLLNHLIDTAVPRPFAMRVPVPDPYSGALPRTC